QHLIEVFVTRDLGVLDCLFRVEVCKLSGTPIFLPTDHAAEPLHKLTLTSIRREHYSKFGLWHINTFIKHPRRRKHGHAPLPKCVHVLLSVRTTHLAIHRSGRNTTTRYC